MPKPTTRTKTKAPALVITTRAELESAVGQLAHSTTEKQRLTAEMEQEITMVRARYETPLGTLTADLEAITAAAAEWAARNPGEFPANRKSLALTHGTIGWRIGQPTLKTQPGWTWDRVLEKLTGTEEWMRFIRIKSEVAKDLLLGERETLGPDALKTLGVRVEQAEPFFIEPKLGTVATRQQTATA